MIKTGRVCSRQNGTNNHFLENGLNVDWYGQAASGACSDNCCPSVHDESSHKFSMKFSLELDALCA
jgi:hypothetical protein